MNLDQYICDDKQPRNLYIEEPGLSYYVRKNWWFEGLIELSNCVAVEGARFGYWRFLKRYESRVPFRAEQVLNPDLAKLYRQRGWTEFRTVGQWDETPQFVSPLAVERFGGDDRFKRLYLDGAV